MAGMTTDELIKQVLEHGDDGCFLRGECDTYQSAPLLARRLRRALEVLEGIYDGTYDAADTNVFLDEIEAMQ